jgi:hypothetical protein
MLANAEKKRDMPDNVGTKVRNNKVHNRENCRRDMVANVGKIYRHAR